jgi:hypothetical protein
VFGDVGSKPRSTDWSRAGGVGGVIGRLAVLSRACEQLGAVGVCAGAGSDRLGGAG